MRCTPHGPGRLRFAAISQLVNGARASLAAVACVLAFGAIAANATSSADHLTGFGARIASWNQHHTADKKFKKNSTYDEAPGLGDNSSVGDRYFAVDVEGGRVENYEMRLLPGTPIREAEAEVLQSEFPPDAHITWFRRRSWCAQILVHSKTLEHTIGHFALVEFLSGDAADHYDPRDASQLTLTTALGNGRSMAC